MMIKPLSLNFSINLCLMSCMSPVLTAIQSFLCSLNITFFVLLIILRNEKCDWCKKRGLKHYCIYLPLIQSVYCQCTDRVQARLPGFDSQHEQEFFLCHHCILISSGVNPVICPEGTWSSLPCYWAEKLTTNLHLVTMLQMHGDLPPLPHMSCGMVHN